MSGGHFDYVGFRIGDGLDRIAGDAIVVRRFPTLAELLRELGGVLPRIEHELDLDLSADAYIADDRAFERRAVLSVFLAAMRAAPDAWFPRGKWATIQAIQGRGERACTHAPSDMT